MQLLPSDRPHCLRYGILLGLAFSGCTKGTSEQNERASEGAKSNKDAKAHQLENVATQTPTKTIGESASTTSPLPPAAPPKPKFKRGDLALGGLIASDVPLYNAAQGDPVQGSFELKQAFAGLGELGDHSQGKLLAVLDTTMGEISCELFETEAPLTVANFIGLAAGTRPYLDWKTKTWHTGKFFDGVVFHRVIKGFMIQSGDPTGSGIGGPGYFVVDEFNTNRRHNAPGVLSMANRNPVDPTTQKLKKDPESGETIGNTGSSQFFITVAPTPMLNDRHTVFGQCDPKVAKAISEVRVMNRPELRIDHRPLEDVKINTIRFERKSK